jgi:hypothetical protein
VEKDFLKEEKQINEDLNKSLKEKELIYNLFFKKEFKEKNLKEFLESKEFNELIYSKIAIKDL